MVAYCLVLPISQGNAHLNVPPPKEHPEVTVAVLLVKTADKPQESSVPKETNGPIS
jgi:hypothetical protein